MRAAARGLRDREVLTTPAATDTARLVKDKHYLIVSKTVGSSEDMGLSSAMLAGASTVLVQLDPHGLMPARFGNCRLGDLQHVCRVLVPGTKA